MRVGTDDSPGIQAHFPGCGARNPLGRRDSSAGPGETGGLGFRSRDGCCRPPMSASPGARGWLHKMRERGLSAGSRLSRTLGWQMRVRHSSLAPPFRTPGGCGTRWLLFRRGSRLGK